MIIGNYVGIGGGLSISSISTLMGSEAILWGSTTITFNN